MANQHARGSRGLERGGRSVQPTSNDTIAAQATAPGVGALAVLRISGPGAAALAQRLTGGRRLPPRHAQLRDFRAVDGARIDRGLALYFPAPRSYTGEDVVELHCHGSPVIVDWLLETLVALGARTAEPGEFTLRAFLNDKLDLAQAEGVADLISSGSRRAVQAAWRSLDGEFSRRVATVQSALTELRVRCEAWLDFPDEEIDRDAHAEFVERARRVEQALALLEADALRGAVLNDGFSVAIAGPPNAGKSSLLNRLAGYEAAIVTPIPGTTRDTVRERISLDGVLLDIVDTAGLRATSDPVEAEGVRRTERAMEVADHVLWVADIETGVAEAITSARRALLPAAVFTVVLNKVDLHDATAKVYSVEGIDVLEISALTGSGLPQLCAHLQARAGFGAEGVGTFSARRRHLDALARARARIQRAIIEGEARPEIAAEELRAAQTALSELTGELTSDDLLGEIFSTFCIGK